MNGYQYEQYCVNYLRANGYFNVTTTPKSKDQGVDIIAYKKRKNMEYNVNTIPIRLVIELCRKHILVQSIITVIVLLL